ncbi:MAG: 2-amino-4-hydroxy-6-hydroxymethyldihydropteridine diphosphokinase [Flavobacteriales bacterium]|nr:2-amino-4-hydroxy-6-hydroxymethyldihydropteridine diphosphokinase [Flavobacteriales bacterium]
MNELVVIIGGNTGDRVYIMQAAIEKLELAVGLVLEKSGIYESEPWGFESVNPFLNQVLILETALDPNQVLEKINQIENELGRERGADQFIDRTMDIDILFYNKDIVETNNLIIPHKELANRRFVLDPLFEIVPEYHHPKLGKTIREIRVECLDNSMVKNVP